MNVDGGVLNSPQISTARIGPMDASPIYPKLSEDSSFPFMEAMPMPNAMMKGTVMAPVVAPPLSKATDRKSAFPLNASTATKANSMIHWLVI